MGIVLVLEHWLRWIDLKWLRRHMHFRIAHHSRSPQASLWLGGYRWVKWNRRISSINRSLFICLKYHDLVVKIGAHSTRVECVHVVLFDTALGTHTVAATLARVWVQITSDVATLSSIECLQLVIVPRPCQSILTCLFGGNEHYLRNDRNQSFVVNRRDLVTRAQHLEGFVDADGVAKLSN